MHNPEIKQLMAPSALVAIIILTGIVFFNSDENITGYAIKEQSKTDFFGTYSIKPSFKAHVDYDLSMYDKIRQDLDIISACVDLGASLETCIRNRAQTKEMLWETDCDKGMQRLFYDIVKLYEDCAKSQDTNCVCAMDFEAKEYAKKNNFQGLYSYSLTANANEYTLSNKQGTLSYSLKGFSTSYAPLTLDYTYTNEKLTLKTTHQKEDGGKYPLTSEFSGIMILKQTKDNKISIDPVGTYSKGLIYPGSIPVDLGGANTNPPECKKPAQTIQRFCVTDTKKTVLAYDAIDGEAKRRPIVIKFAAYMQDTPPAPVQNLKVEDAPKAEKSLVVSWDESASGDVSSYIVYQSTAEDAFNGPTSTFRDKVTATTYKTSQKKQLDSTIDLKTCTLSLEDKTCLFSGQKLDKNTLYSMPNTNGKQTLFVVAPVDEDGKDYWFAVTAIDQNGNEADNVKPQQKVSVGSKASLDDLPLRSEGIAPLPANAATNYNKQTQTFTFSNFITPTLNADGNPATGYKDVVLLYKKKETDMPANAPLSFFDGEIVINPQPGTSFSIPLSTESGSVYYLVLVARDQANNPQKTLTPADIGATVLELPIT